jgi:hypothetical protein
MVPLKIASSTRRYRNGIWAFVYVQTLQTMIRMCLHHLSKSGGNYRIEIYTLTLHSEWQWRIWTKQNQYCDSCNCRSRTVAFAIADGQLPSIQEQDMWFGVFYVVQYVTDLLFEYQRTFYLSIGSCFSGPNGWGFPEIRKQQGLVTNVIREEETSFAYTGSRVTVVR